MTTSPALAQALNALLEEMEADLFTDDILPLYRFDWFLKGDNDLSPADVDALCRLAYEELCRRHTDLQLGWVNWPDIGPDEAIAAEPDTSLRFTLDPSEESREPLLVLFRPA